ncbi:tetratricopeptide repeat protein 32-like [Ptychodera flava]|uniref:tetratricopeptide repeat protein 32-like n=1 Tax=Ptychodera flava TaxID=63121 RepID=UPI00396A3A10
MASEETSSQWTVFEKAENLADSGKILEAEQEYTKFIEQVTSGYAVKLNRTGLNEDVAKQLALAHNNRGQLRYLQVEFVRAVQDYTEAIKLQKDLTVSYYNRGQIHYRLSRFDEAIKDFKETLHQDPKFEEAKIALNAAIVDKDTKERRQHQR